MSEISKYWQNQGVTQKKEGRVFSYDSEYMQAKGLYYACNECCNGDRCDDPTHRRRENCVACLGTTQNLTSERLNKEVQGNK
jgi:sulfur transfer protein SufE